MPYTFRLMDEADARVIAAWRYDTPYTIYNAANPNEIADLLERRSPYYAARDDRGDLVGFFAYGTAGEVEGFGEPRLYGPDRVLTIGLGLRPDLTGRGLGLAFVEAGLVFARERFAPAAFRLFVLTFNERAIRVYERAGFETARVIQRPDGLEFLEMRRMVDSQPAETNVGGQP